LGLTKKSSTKNSFQRVNISPYLFVELAMVIAQSFMIELLGLNLIKHAQLYNQDHQYFG
jgi:hypothetical protein